MIESAFQSFTFSVIKVFLLNAVGLLIGPTKSRAIVILFADRIRTAIVDGPEET